MAAWAVSAAQRHHRAHTCGRALAKGRARSDKLRPEYFLLAHKSTTPRAHYHHPFTLAEHERAGLPEIVHGVLHGLIGPKGNPPRRALVVFQIPD